MPVSNGDQLLREAAQRYPRIVRMLVTAYADKDMLLRTVNTGGVFRIIEKPLRIDTVRETLREAIAQWTERETRQHELLAMDETLAFLAHELNTPLATIALIAQTTIVTMRFGTRKERAKATDTQRPLEPQSSLDTPG